MVPCIRLSSSEQIANPKPAPPTERDSTSAICSKGLKMSACFSGAIPKPESLMLKKSISRSATVSVHALTIISPCSVNFIALLIRLMRICRTRVASTRITNGKGSSDSNFNDKPLSRADTRISVNTSAIRLSRLTSPKLSSSLSTAILDKSKTSFSKLNKCLPLR